MAGKRSVGLIVFTHKPQDGLVAILQKRGDFNDEEMRPESFPGGCQTTVWGSLEEEDKGDYDAALKREIGQEAGWVWLADFLIARTEGKKAIHLEDPSVTGGNISVWAVYFPIESIRTIRLSAATGGLVYLTAEKLNRVHDLKRDFDRDAGVPLRTTVAAFSDAKEILARGFVWAETVNPDYQNPKS